MKTVIVFKHSYKVGLGLINGDFQKCSFYTEEDCSDFYELNKNILEEETLKSRIIIKEAFPEIKGTFSVTAAVTDWVDKEPGSYLFLLYFRQFNNDYPEVIEELELIDKLTDEQVEEIHQVGELNEYRDRVQQLKEEYANNYHFSHLTHILSTRLVTCHID